jgi:DNA-directed RNA polymerase III subunit RPC2
LTTGPQLLVTFGLVVGFFTCYGSANLDSSLAWRVPFIMLAILSFAFSIASFLWLVPSPRWLTLRGRSSEAAAAWDVLGVSQAEREKVEIEQSREAINLQTQGPADPTDSSNNTLVGSIHTKDRETKQGFLDLFSRDVRARTTLAVFMMGMQQLSGIDGVLYVSLVRSARSSFCILTLQVRSSSLSTSWVGIL